jgi:hypothetical protein
LVLFTPLSVAELGDDANRSKASTTEGVAKKKSGLDCATTSLNWCPFGTVSHSILSMGSGESSTSFPSPLPPLLLRPALSLPPCSSTEGNGAEACPKRATPVVDEEGCSDGESKGGGNVEFEVLRAHGGIGGVGEGEEGQHTMEQS